MGTEGITTSTAQRKVSVPLGKEETPAKSRVETAVVAGGEVSLTSDGRKGVSILVNRSKAQPLGMRRNGKDAAAFLKTVGKARGLNKRDTLIEVIRTALLDADRNYFLTGDAIIQLKSITRPGTDRGMYSFRDIARLLGNWQAGFLSKLATVAGSYDDEARRFAINNSLGWQCCYNLYAARRRDESDKPMLECLKTYLETIRAERPQPQPDQIERCFNGLIQRHVSKSYNARLGEYGLQLYRAVRAWKTYTDRLAQWQHEATTAFQVQLGERKKRADQMRIRATMSVRKFGADDMLAEADFESLLNALNNPTGEEFDPGTLEGASAIRRTVASADVQPVTF